MNLILCFLKRPSEKSFQNKKDIYSTPVAAHRLDRATGGLVIFGKAKTSLDTISQSFKERTIEKTYRAVIVGHLDLLNETVKGKCTQINTDNRTCIISDSIDGKSAETHCTILSYHIYEVTVSRKCKLSRTNEHADVYSISECEREKETLLLTKVELRPKSGRTHQLRKHMKILGCPILGDRRYGGREAKSHVRNELKLHLHALKLSFPHPRTGKRMDISSKEPEYFDYPVTSLHKIT